MRKITKSCIEDTVSSTISVVFCAFMDVESVCATDFSLFFFFLGGVNGLDCVYLFIGKLGWVGFRLAKFRD